MMLNAGFWTTFEGDMCDINLEHCQGLLKSHRHDNYQKTLIQNQVLSSTFQGLYTEYLRVC